MRTLSRKRLRDLWSLRGPATAIALVLACGVAAYVSSRAVTDTLTRSQASFYREQRFADVFAGATRAPERVAAELRRLPGVSAVETRVKGVGSLTVAGFDQPIAGLFVSLPDVGEPLLNGLHVVDGALPREGRSDEVVLSDAFAEVHGLRPGDRVGTVLRGQARTLTVVGTARSPEFLYQVPPGAVLPDFERFAIAWMRRDGLAAALGVRGAFSDVSLRLGPGAPRNDVLDGVDAVLAPYGGGQAIAREDQPSHYFVSEELKQLAQQARVMPTLFIGVAVFLLAVVVGRLVQTQREIVATLKAFGYPTATILAHYLGLVAVMVAAGVVLGVALGAWMGHAMAGLYVEFYRFPSLHFTLPARVVVEASALAGVAALATTFRAVRATAMLPPAVAMREPVPPVFARSIVERMGLGRLLGGPERMIVRHIERRPLRSLLSVVGIAAACAIVMLGRFSTDAFTRVLDLQYGRAHREDVDVAFVEARGARAALELAALPGVQAVESYRVVGVELRRGPRRFTTAITGRDASATLARVLDAEGRPVTLPPDGLVLSEYIAGRLGVSAGDTVEVHVQEGDRRVVAAPVARLVTDYVGAGVSMERHALHRLLGEGERLSGAWLAVDDPALPALYAALAERPAVARSTGLGESRAALEATFVDNSRIFNTILMLLAMVIAFGVLYNTARLSLAEQSRELASLRVLGFTVAEIAYLFFGELALLVLVSLPVGLALGAGFCYAYVAGLQSEAFRIPFVLTPASYASTATVILVAAVLSAWPMARRLRRLDLVGVLKVRE